MSIKAIYGCKWLFKVNKLRLHALTILEFLSPLCFFTLLVSQPSFKINTHPKRSPWRTSNLLWSSLDLTLMPHILPTSTNETICEEAGYYCPVCHKAFALVCSVSGNATKHFTTHRQAEIICCLQSRSICCSLFDYLWMKPSGYFPLVNFRVLC